MEKEYPEKSVMIQYIIDESRRVSKQKNKKKLKRCLETARLYLYKSTMAQVENLYDRVKNEGAEKVFQ